MSWYRDPQLFIYSIGSGYRICRVNKKLLIGTAFLASDISDDNHYYKFSEHLSLGNNKESDYADFLSDLSRRPKYTLVNSQGLVASGTLSTGYIVFRWDPDALFYSLPGIRVNEQDQQKTDEEVQALEKRVSDLETTVKHTEKKLTAQVADLQKQLYREKYEKEALDKQVFELTLKLEAVVLKMDLLKLCG